MELKNIWPWTGSVAGDDLKEVNNQIRGHSQIAQDLRITTFALAMIAIALMGISYGLFGAGTLPPTALNGLGMFPYFGGIFLSFVTIGLVFSSLITLALSGIESYQKGKWSVVGDRQ